MKPVIMRYDFQCNSCDKISEIELPMSFEDYESLECPECSETGMQKIFSAPNIATGNNKSNTPACATGKCPFA